MIVAGERANRSSLHYSIVIYKQPHTFVYIEEIEIMRGIK